MQNPSVSLLELNSQIKDVLKAGFRGPVWVRAEITELKVNSTGHCYLALADKGGGDKIEATARATIWASTYSSIRIYFQTMCGRPLSVGMSILALVDISFHELYGLSLNIKDIDPSFSLGDIERRRREILEKLEKEGLIDLNRGLGFPLLPKNVAVISSDTAAGYGDFMRHLNNNGHNYKFNVRLFNASMQGEQTSSSVINALNKIASYGDFFQVVVIIRGGGATTDLSYFDDYNIACQVAQFPLPIISGIGHEKDVTILDRVANMRAKTPTDAADILITAFLEAENMMNDLKDRCVVCVTNLLEGMKQHQNDLSSAFCKNISLAMNSHNSTLLVATQSVVHNVKLFNERRMSVLNSYYMKFQSGFSVLLREKKNSANVLISRLKQAYVNVVESNNSKLRIFETTVKMSDPTTILKRGFSVTRINGKAVSSSKSIKTGDEIVTILADGEFKAVVK